MSARAAAPKTVTEYLAVIPEPQRADAKAHAQAHPQDRADPEAVPEVRRRKNGLALHVMPPSDGSPMPEIRKDRFPKGDVGMSCVRFRKRDDLDEGAIVALVRAALRARTTWATK